MPKSKRNQTKSHKYKYLVLYNCVQKKKKKQEQNKTSHETNMKKIEI